MLPCLLSTVTKRKNNREEGNIEVINCQRWHETSKQLTQTNTMEVVFTGLAGGGALGPMLWGTGPGIPAAMGTLCPATGPRASIPLGSRPAEGNKATVTIHIWWPSDSLEVTSVWIWLTLFKVKRLQETLTVKSIKCKKKVCFFFFIGFYKHGWRVLNTRKYKMLTKCNCILAAKMSNNCSFS